MLFRRAPAFALLVSLGVTVATVGALQLAPPMTDAVARADEKILAEIHDHNEIMTNLEYLSDMIGGRLTGSESLKKANDWTRQKFADYGVANPHLEPWTIAHTWTRVSATARIISPSVHPLTIASYAWAASTNGTVRGHVVYVEALSTEGLAKYKGKLKDAIVITAEPALLPPPDQPAPSPVEIPYGDEFLLVAPPRPGPAVAFGPELVRFIQARTEFFKNEGVLAKLSDSGKPDDLLNMSTMGGGKYDVAPVPAAFISSESYGMIWRLLQRGPVDLELNIVNRIGDQPTEVYNTVAEIRGSEKPDEIVVLGAHLDSWDLGEGTTDNGTGSMIVLEAARVLQKLGLQPKRTIRFVLFSGEEQGLVGARAYVAAHKEELPKISAALVNDTGTGRVISISLMNNYQDREVMDQVVAPLHAIGLLELSERWMAASDHAPFEEAGVPGFFCVQKPAQYFQTHHSQADTFDQAHEPDLVEGAQVMAVWAYNVAQLPDLLPRRPAHASRTSAGN